MDYEMELRELMDLDSRTITDWENYQKFMLGVANNRLRSESKLQTALYMALKQLEELREESKNATIHEDDIVINSVKLNDHYKDMRGGRKIAYKEKITKERVLRALKNNNGCRALAAKELKCSTKTIYNRLKS